MHKDWTPAEIRALRERLGMTVEQFAWSLGGVTVSAVRKWENGERSPSATTKAMFEVLDPDEGRG
jgi:DNA-binding transcriptional regulator YiaG